VYPRIVRAFRRVRWISAQETQTPKEDHSSLLDEQLAGVVTDPNEQLLLWRPQYVSLLQISNSDDAKAAQKRINPDEALQSTVDTFIKKRQMSQLTLSDINPALRKVQSGIITAFGAFIPRTPARRHQERELVEDRKAAQSFLLASSLLSNCPEDYLIHQGILEEQIGVETFVAKYTHKDTQSQRLLVLETAGARSLEEAQKNGQALSRLCLLNSTCRNLLQTTLTTQKKT
jgi:hypothetical protein